MSEAVPNRSRRGVWAVVALVLSAGGGLSCGSSSPLLFDGGAGKTGSDARVDRVVVSGSGGANGTDGPATDAPIDASRDQQLAAIGATCSVSGDCASGHCFDGVCCQQDCSGACHSCALPGNVGTCTLADVGTDPRSDCPDEGSASCGMDGTCDGSGACRKYPTGIVCKQPSCGGSTLTLAFRCTGGACTPTSGQPCDPYICSDAMSCANTCTTNADCTPPNICNNGSCGKRGLGRVCTTNDDCNSGICQQGVCCSTACTGTCRSCALPGSEGACTNVPERQDPLDQCPDSGAASCGTDGTCDGVGACRFYAKGTTCRAIAGACDVAETCAGGGAPCPTDGFLRGNVCRATAGSCDVAETCSGTSAACPADALVPPGTVCRQLAGICDVAEACTGTSAACPADVFAPATLVCRASTGLCDVAETCSGTAAACPPDGFVAAGTVCRALVGACDVPERCSGSTAACPPDGFVAAGTVCHAAVDLCDAPETCSGVGSQCPPDALVPAGIVCRGSAGVCDVAETCTGSSTACPPDAFAPSSMVCRSAVSVCDVAENCTGAAAACPADAVVAAGAVVCRSAAGGCDVAESCDGASNVCPIDSMAMTPIAPTNLAAARGNNMATLTWTAVPGATSYTIGRSAVSGGPFTTVGTSTTTTFVANGLTNGTMFFFVVSATTVGPGCVSPNSMQVAVIPSACPGVYCDDFEADTLGTQANGWTRVGGSAGDWAVTAAGTKFFSQVGSVSATFRAAFSSGAPGAPWSGATSVSADVELNTLGISGQAAFLCVRFVDTSNFYCAVLSPTGIQIQTKVGGNTNNSAVFAQSINPGSIQQVKLSLSAAGVLSVTLNSSVRATLTPPALANGFVAVGTASVEASFDTIVVSQP
jgi:hypothetical protein